VIAGLWEGVVDKAVTPFFGIEEAKKNGGGDMVLVKELDLGRR